VEVYLHRPAEELYDLTADPDEVVNLAGSAAHAQTLEALRTRVQEWRKATKDPWL
jgi:N-sulfoglucosamine sulfohydrolase